MRATFQSFEDASARRLSWSERFPSTPSFASVLGFQATAAPLVFVRLLIGGSTLQAICLLTGLGAKCSPRPDVNVVTRSGRSRSAEEILQIAFSSDVERNHLDDEDFSLDVEDCESTESDSDDEPPAANSRGASCTSRPLVR